MRFADKMSALAVSGAFALGTLAAPAAAAAVPWKKAIVDYQAQGKDLTDVLRDFGSSQGLPTRIAPGVSGTVSGNFHLPPRRFIDTLAASFGFVWYYDGSVLDITTASDLQSRLVKLDTAGTASLRSALDRLHIGDDRFPIVYDNAQGTALVNGPPRYVQMVAAVASRLDSNAARSSGTEVRVFPLSHAWAKDRTVPINNQTVTLEGVASVLNGIYHPGNAKNPAQTGVDRVRSAAAGVKRNVPLNNVNGLADSGASVPPPIPLGEKGKGMFSGLTGQPSSAVMAAVGEPPAPDGAPAESSDDDRLPVIVADQRTNSVVIRDRTDRMTQYGALIERLDVKPQLIEIEAHIIEIDDNALQQLGIDWTAHNSHVDLQTGSGTGPQNMYNGGTITQNFGNTTLAGNVIAAASPVGASLAAVLGDAGRYLMARVSALQQTDAAKIDASPKVVTLNNIEAVMDNQTQFFVPVTGYTAADLYSISAGVSLRVLPMVVTEDGHTRIKLDVAIQDGQVNTAKTVGNLPTVTNSTIDTQAFIDEGQALLIAGYRAESDLNGVTGVPMLSKIPLVGALFRTKNTQRNRMERLFLLTPRVISP
ncbi:EscC/YscC/HrcC family type III secretion system outer membrane ring protein [Burkholderia sp. Ac-20384]|uniref:type III secretion system outer membrane ring subunit SctC n=1 Tax=Burkholderia sp. Ac-20384 TaxID=2703902 RepID=UPI0019825D70|nr:type III secretion system outer membrane ring subunit SctC [Burkholderia sp. Ac-20384]MBN3825112.1 EscC/YscC/HrcC family type III secretion system outer membrane ring protein [Burkholderia sp. Ac-20384]